MKKPHNHRTLKTLSVFTNLKELLYDRKLHQISSVTFSDLLIYMKNKGDIFQIYKATVW